MGEGRSVELTERALAELRSDEALVFDWHRVAICCAAAGEVSLRRTTAREIERTSRFVALSDSQPVYAHRRVYPHLAGRSVEVDCRRLLDVRRFTANLPSDFGLRAVFGRLPAEFSSGGSP